MAETISQKKANRWIPVIASIAIQLCLGTAYIWSVFQNGIAGRLFGGNNASAGLTFSLLLGVLTFGSTIGGMLQDKFSPKPVIIGGGIILGAGFMLASLTTAAAPWMLWVTYGVLGGFGMGTIYSTTIACCQKWFPDKRGFITGMIVAALGFGGVVFTPIAELLIRRLGNGVAGAGELGTFLWLGIIFVIVCVIGAFFVKNPPQGYKPDGWNPPERKKGAAALEDFAPREVVRTPQFYMVTGTLMLACMAGLMMIGFAKPIAVAKGLGGAAAVGVMIISIFNSCGRLFWGWVSDRMGRKNTILMLLIATAVAIPFVNMAGGYWIFALIALIGLFYGGFLGVFPALTADFFGTRNMGMNYGMVLLGFGVGAVASSYIAGHFKNIAANDINLMLPAFLIASAAAVLGAALMFFVKPPKHKKAAEQ